MAGILSQPQCVNHMGTSVALITRSWWYDHKKTNTTKTIFIFLGYIFVCFIVRESNKLIYTHMSYYFPIVKYDSRSRIQFYKFSTHWGQDKMATIFQTTFSNAFSSVKIYESKVVPKGPINNIPALVQIIVCHWQGDKPLFEPMVVSFLMHICITRP